MLNYFKHINIYANLHFKAKMKVLWAWLLSSVVVQQTRWYSDEWLWLPKRVHVTFVEGRHFLFLRKPSGRIGIASPFFLCFLSNRVSKFTRVRVCHHKPLEIPPPPHTHTAERESAARRGWNFDSWGFCTSQWHDCAPPNVRVRVVACNYVTFDACARLHTAQVFDGNSKSKIAPQCRA